MLSRRRFKAFVTEIMHKFQRRLLAFELESLSFGLGVGRAPLLQFQPISILWPIVNPSPSAEWSQLAVSPINFRVPLRAPNNDKSMTASTNKYCATFINKFVWFRLSFFF